jgi:phosphatidylglycerol:prolipoprotein diacylglycerol transferase
MFYLPTFDPVAFRVGALKVHWYGLMYLIGFLGAWVLAVVRARKPNSGWTPDQLGDLIFCLALGVILGGRLGYVLFYNAPYYLAHPGSIFAVWDGGMSFHGGLLGVVVAIFIYSRSHGRCFGDVSDYIAPLVPIGLGAGRLGNFINGELVGRRTGLPWGVIYPNAGPYPRHPNEIYEFLLEGVVLFIILWLFSGKPRQRFAISALFLLCYGVFRFFIEFFRQPDPQLGFLAWHWVTMGQVLSLPMVLIGGGALLWIYRKEDSV